MCGGTGAVPASTCAATGLSPRVRGNHPPRRQLAVPVRSIPACAGEPAPNPITSTATSVYPRVCGGTRPPLPRRIIRRRQGIGPPALPQATRKETPPRRKVYPRVCGGTRASRRPTSIVIGLSPRVRGNLWRYAAATGRRVGGLSPRVRGNRCQGLSKAPRRRSIPACAGEPPRHTAATSPAQVYPRVCGGTRRWGDSIGHFLGLSPRVRGNHPRRWLGLFPLWSIPACAGEPWALSCAPACRSVYPRVCGGTRRWRRYWTRGSGLSPRVRGNRGGLRRGRGMARSIPACAGEPSGQHTLGVDAGVYPRVCGGTATGRFQAVAGVGLSPRVRGNPRSPAMRSRPSRSIPACAGEPGSR